MSIRLPRLSSAQAALDNAIAAIARRPVRLTIADHKVRLRWTTRSEPFATAAALDLDVQGLPVRVVVDADPVAEVLDLPVSAEDLARLPRSFQAALIASAYKDALDRAAGLGLAAEPRAYLRGFVRSKPAPGDARASFAPDALRLGWELRDPGDGLWLRGELLLAAALGDRIVELVRAMAAPDDATAVEDWPARARLRLGRSVLEVRELDRVEPGDVVLVDQHAWNDHRAEIRIDGGFCYDVEVAERTVTVSDKRESRRVADDEAPDSADGPEGSAPPEDAPVDIDDMLVTVAFDLGQIEVPLGELRRIGKGYTFNLHKPLDGTIRMRVNGRVIGHGELVEIEGSLGVRVTDLFAKGHG